MYLHCNIPPISCFIRNEYLYDGDPEQIGEFTEGLAFSVKSTKNHALMFQVMTDIGAVFDKIPIHGLCDSKDSVPMPLDWLQLWDCPSYHFTCVQFDFLKNKKCKVFLKDRELHSGRYLFTLDWAADKLPANTGFSEYWPEHKSAHVIQLSTGQFCAQPNNRILWADPSWIHDPFGTVPDYKVCQKEYVVEASSKWATEDTDFFFYDTKENYNESTEPKDSLDNLPVSHYVDSLWKGLFRGGHSQSTDKGENDS